MRLVESKAGLRLVEVEAPRPEPGKGEVLIRVHAAGVTPTEFLWYPTTHAKNGEPRQGAVPGHEFSGTIAALGEGVNAMQAGDAVYGMNGWFAEGATAEYCLAPWSSIAPKPMSLSHAEAATVPIGALTAWQGLFDRAKLQPGERVLVHGGAGAVGLFAVQLAHHSGADVLATASERQTAFVLQLGASQVIDYRAARFEDVVGQVDVVFDTVGGETLQRSWSVLKPNGRLVTIAATEEGSGDERSKNAFFLVEPNRQQLIAIGEFLVSGRLRPCLDEIVSFAEADAAYRGLLQRRGPGKIAVSLFADPGSQSNLPSR